MRSHQHAVDARLIHREPGFVALTASATIASQVQRAKTRTEFKTILRIEAIDVSSGDEDYLFLFETSNVSNFATRETAAVLSLGHTSTRLGTPASNAAGDEYEVCWCTEVNKTIYQYWRIRALLSGTTPSIQFSMNSTV